MKKYNTVIIGGGAAGMAAALAAFYKDKTLKTAIIEKNKTLGKKILATGNGKCNLSNENVSWENYYPYKNNFYFDILKKNEDYIKKLFDKLGILFYTDESGRIYPSSCSAKTVNEAFIREIKKTNTDVFCETEIFKIEKYGEKWKLFSKTGDEFLADKVIFAVGGFAAPEFGTNGVSWKILQNMGIETDYAEAALCPLYTSENIKPLKGLRVRAKIRVYEYNLKQICERLIYMEDNSEVQFGEDYISGVGVMNATAFIKNDDISSISLDIAFQHKTDLNEYFRKIIENRPQDAIETIYDGICDRRLGKYILTEYLGIKDISKPIESLDDVEEIINGVENVTFSKLKKGTWKQSQTTMGGVKSEEVAENLELKKAKGIYVCGEVCNINGMCGGYNLAWAWVSGIICGLSLN